MYLENFYILNVGPIPKFDMSFNFDANGNPKPTIFVGKNGSGKSILLSYIADSLIEIAKSGHQNITGNSNQEYFRISGGFNTTQNEPFSLALLQFRESLSSTTIVYSDKSGQVDRAAIVSNDNVDARFPNLPHWSGQENQKVISGVADETSRNIFQNNVLTYFPPSRHERPFWLVGDKYKTPSFYSPKRYFGQLDKEVIAETTWDVNRSWIMSVYLDSLSDVKLNNEGQLEFRINDPNRYANLQVNRRNVEKVISMILQSDDLALFMHTRQAADSTRLSVIRNGALIIPSIDNLSTGQSVLLNMFTTILRHAEHYNLELSRNLQDIIGIVIIDEVDAHIHSDLQATVLPELISLFPKVQFFISSHAPLFLLGMEKRFGSENVNIIDMPSGAIITSERFSEFQASLDYYKDTQAYEESVQNRLKQASRPIVFTEGPTDVKYIKTALTAFGRQDILSSIDIEPVGAFINGKEIGGGDTGLDRLREFVRANPTYITRSTMLLYDCDTDKGNEVSNNLWVRTIPYDATKSANTKGIENLLPEEYFSSDDATFVSLFGAARDEFWVEKPVPSKGYGSKGSIEEFQKAKFCSWFCSAQADASTLSGFSVVVTILDKFILGDATL